MCGVLGIYRKGSAVEELYQGLIALQHRGQDSAGIITYDELFHLKKGMGLITSVFNQKNLERLKGTMGIGHVRYPTIGPGSFEDAQPFFVNAPYGIAMAHNGNVTNYFSLRKKLEKKFLRKLNSYSDVEVILNVFAWAIERDKKKFSFDLLISATDEVFKQVRGSYSVVGLIADKGIFAFRDPNGIKPLVFGAKNSNFAFASESVAFDLLGYKLVRDVKPGELIFIDKERQIHSKVIKESKSSTPCIFEFVYFARPDSIIDGIGVYEARLRLGKYLGEECLKAGLKPDVVIPVPDTARAAAFLVAEILNVPCREALIKNRYIPRTFIMPRQSEREISVQQKLNPIISEIKNKKVLIIDDSIVRGTTSKEIVAMVRKGKAKKVYLAITCPPLRFPCVYGIDMMTRGEFIAKKYDLKKIKELIGADELIYQTYEGLIKGVRGEKRNQMFCTACFSGEYPTRITKKEFEILERERSRWQKGLD